MKNRRKLTAEKLAALRRKHMLLCPHYDNMELPCPREEDAKIEAQLQEIER